MTLCWKNAEWEHTGDARKVSLGPQCCKGESGGRQQQRSWNPLGKLYWGLRNRSLRYADMSQGQGSWVGSSLTPELPAESHNCLINHLLRVCVGFSNQATSFPLVKMKAFLVGMQVLWLLPPLSNFWFLVPRRGWLLSRGLVSSEGGEGWPLTYFSWEVFT